jgi:hypothetical protein
MVSLRFFSLRVEEQRHGVPGGGGFSSLGFELNCVPLFL